MNRVLIEDFLKPAVVGEDPFNVDRIWEKMYRLTFNYDRKGAPPIA